MMKKLILIVILLPVLILVIGCESEKEMTPSSGKALALTFSELPPLTNGFHYEGWAIVNGQPLTTGKFNVDNQGQLVTLGGQAIPNKEFKVGQDISSASDIVITIEPKGDTDTKPAATKILGGKVVNNAATLKVEHSASLGNDFTSATGKYVLATPTDDDTTNEKSGVWFLQLPGPSVGLNLPTLPNGWKYEGWVVVNDVPLTTGKFTSVTGEDESHPYSGPKMGPPFPGEDYLQKAPSGLTFPIDLSGAIIVITIEPNPDDNPAPYPLKPLVGTVPISAQDHFTYMTNQAGTFPTGTATIK
jgi:hypothetical protein